MGRRKNILVPIEFSERPQAALNHAIGLAKELRAELLLVHVITAPAVNVPIQLRAQYYKEFREEASRAMERLMQRRKVKAEDYRLVILRGEDAARLITEQAVKSRSSMIVMGSRGRTGLQRLILGSVAERTLRYAPCPILIVKK